MITSMTGFGRGEASKNGIQVTAEIKTLNSRYLDLTVRLPSQILEKELTVKELIQKKINRGKVNLNVYLSKTSTGEPDITFNPDLVKSYGQLLQQIHDTANLSGPISLNDLLRFDDIFIHRKTDLSTIKMIWEMTCVSIEEAIETVNTMRCEEGGQLKNELAGQISDIDQLLSNIERMAENRVPEIQKRLRDRLNILLADDKIDPSRLEPEIALLADKMDINEEVVRLKSHLKFFLEALESAEPVGRRLNFLCQEISRELNTIGSKANDSGISHQVVNAKEKLEQIREQVQNIE